MKKIIVLGGNGFLASHFNYEKVLDRLTPNDKELKNIIEKYKPDVIINCAGYGGETSVDDCLNNKEKTIINNLTIPTILANICNNKNIHYIQIGSGCVYFKDQDLTPQTEETPANPLSFYSKTKYACDLAINNLPNVLIPRIRMPISYKPNPRNFINKLLRYNKITPLPNSVSFVGDIVNAIEWMIKNEKIGIYNTVNSPALTNDDILKEYNKYKKYEYTLVAPELSQSLTKDKRSNVILSNDKLAKEGFQMPNSREQLTKYMKEYINNIQK